MPNKILAVIPARSGSKSIKDKNLLKIKGKTLIDIAVTKAIKSKLFSKVLISTDSKAYALEAINREQLFDGLRSKKLSGGNVTLALGFKRYLDKIKRQR